MQVAAPGQGATGRRSFSPPPEPLTRRDTAEELDNLGYAYLQKTLTDLERRQQLLYRARRGDISYEKR